MYVLQYSSQYSFENIVIMDYFFNGLELGLCELIEDLGWAFELDSCFNGFGLFN